MRRPLALALLLTLLATPAAAQNHAELEGKRVAQVHVVVPPGVDKKELERFLEIRAGDRWSARQVRRSIEVISKLGDFRSITAEAAETPEGIVLTLRLLPNTKIRKVSYHGTKGLPGRLPSIVGVVAGDSYPGDEALERMAEDVKLYLEGEGWRDAQVSVRATKLPEGDVTVDVDVTPGNRVRIDAVKFVGDHPFTELELAQEARVKPGQPLRQGSLKAARDRLTSYQRKLGYYEAKTRVVAYDAEDGKATVDFMLNSGERVHVVFDRKELPWPERKKNPLLAWEFRESRLVAAIDLESEHNITEGFAAEAADRVASYYHNRGFLEAKAEATLDYQPAKRLKTLHVKVDSGRRFRLRKIVFRGNDEKSKEQRAKTLREIFLGGSTALKQEHYVQEEVDLAATRLVNYLRSEGYGEAEVQLGEPQIDRAKRTVDLAIDVDAGARTRVGDVTFEGNEQVPSKKLESVVGQDVVAIRPGEPLNLVLLDRADEAIESYYSSIGFPYASVRHDAVVGTDGNVKIGFDVDESFQAYVGRIIIRGNRHTKREVIDRALPLETGQSFTPAVLKASEAAVYKLGTFTRVDALPFEQDEPERVRDVLIAVNEAKRYELEPSIGASSDDGPRLAVRGQHRNLFGSAKSLSFRAQANWPWDGFVWRTNGLDAPPRPDLDYTRINGRFLLTYAQPTIFGEPFRGSISANLIETERRRTFGHYGNRVIAGASRELATEWGPLAGASITVVGRYSLFLRSIDYQVPHARAEFESSKEREAKVALEPADLELRKGRQLYYWPLKWKVAGASFATIIDKRDDRFNPTRGFAGGFTTELTSRALGSDVSFAKATGSLSVYAPVPGRFTLAVAARAGYAFPLEDTAGIPIDQRFHVGGTGSVRGFAEASVGPHFERVTDRSTGGDAFGLYNLELRRGLIPGMQWVVFHDLGWAHIYRTSYDPAHRRGVDGLYGKLDEYPEGWADQDRGGVFGPLVNPLRPSMSVGLGLRAKTPVGPMKFDFGLDVEDLKTVDELNDVDNLRPRVHFTLGDF